MSYKNTMKLFASNFTLVWKQLLYLICCLLVFSLCTSTILNPIIDLLKQNGIGEDLKTIFNTIYNTPSEFALRISDMLKHIINAIFDNFSEIYLYFFGFIIFCLFLPYVLIQMSVFNITSILSQKLTMNMNVSYTQNMLKTFTKSLKFALANIVLNLPYFAVVLVLIELYLVLSSTIITALVGLMVLTMLLIIITALNISIFTCYTAYMVENDVGPFVAFGKGVAMVFKDFWKVLSISIIVVLTLILINCFTALFTFLSGLFVTIPATFVLLAIYNLVTYFNIKGERYYLSETIIYNPIKYTVKKDDYVSISVPEVTKEINVTTTVIKKKYKKTKSNKKPTKNLKSK